MFGVSATFDFWELDQLLRYYISRTILSGKEKYWGL